MSKILLFSLLLISGCKDKSDIYTLYRNSPIDFSMRIHVATFDAKEKGFYGNYNQENCKTAKELFKNNNINGISDFWCEKGKFKK